MEEVNDSARASDTTSHDTVNLAAKMGIVLREEASALHPRLMAMYLIAGLIPRYVGIRLRRYILRGAGIQVGRGTIVMGMPRMYGSGDIHRRLHIGSNVVINVDCFFDLNASIMISDHVALGHEVMILTSSHNIGSDEHRAGPLYTAPVTIREGAWIGSRSLILPGVTVGAGSVVGAGAVVTKDVPARTLVGGVPARTIRNLD